MEYYSKEKKLKSNIILLILSFLSMFFYWGFRFSWHFEMSGKRINLMYAMILIALCFLASLYIFIKNKKTKWKIPLFILTLLGVILNIVTVFLRGGDLKAYGRFLTDSLYVFIPTVLSVVFLFYPFDRIIKKQKIKLILICGVFFLNFIVHYSIYPIKFIAKPVVFDCGEQYAVVWTTNVDGVGWVNITKDNKTEQIYHTNNGKRIAKTKIHTVYIDKDILDGASYKVSTKKLIFHSANKAIFGKTLEGSATVFKHKNNSEDITFLTVSDYHSMISSPIKLAENAGDFDFLMLNGDIISFVPDMKETEISVLVAVAEMTHGAIPVMFTRGNHEMMSYGTEYINEYVRTPNDKYYYTFKYNSIYAIVLDPGIDKPDNHYSYGGLVDCTAYRKEQTEWLKNVLDTNEYKNSEYFLVFSHVPLFAESDAYKETMNDWRALLNGKGVDMSFSGHTHKYKYNPPDANHDFPIIEDGGKIDTLGRHIIATRVKINDGIKIEFIDDTGKIIGSH